MARLRRTARRMKNVAAVRTRTRDSDVTPGRMHHRFSFARLLRVVVGSALVAAAATTGARAPRVFDMVFDAARVGAAADAFAEGLRADAARPAVHLRISVPENGDFSFMGCGLVARVRGDRGTALSGYVPSAYQRVGCDGVAYRIRALWQNHTYHERFRLADGERPAAVHVEIDEHAFALRGTVCVGYSSAAAGDRPRAFCVDDALLAACHQVNSGMPNVYYAQPVNVLPFFSMSQSNESTSRITFRDVGTLLGAFRALLSNTDDVAARSAVCGRIDAVRGVSALSKDDFEDQVKCEAAAVLTDTAALQTTAGAEKQYVSLKNCSEIVRLPE